MPHHRSIKTGLSKLIVICALPFLTACATTTTSSSSFSDNKMVSQKVLEAPKKAVVSQAPKAVEVATAPELPLSQVVMGGEAQASGLTSQPDQTGGFAVAVAIDVSPQAADEFVAGSDQGGGQVSAMAMAATPEQAGVLDSIINKGTCTNGLTGNLVTGRAGDGLLAKNGLVAGQESVTTGQGVVASVSLPLAETAGADVTKSVAEAPPAMASLNLKMGQTEGLLVTGYQQTGRHYKSGGQSPASGFDAAGFTRWVYGQRGVSLPSDAKRQALGGRQVAKDELRPGDILVYNTKAGKYHVGIYTGKGNFLHADDKTGVVTETAAFGPQYSPYFVGGRRYYDDPKATPLSDSQKMAATSSAVKLALSELGPNDKPDRSSLSPKAKGGSKKK